MNIREFAKICGCSYGTVTNAFLQPEKVKKATLEKILRLAEHYKYRPNHVAASLKCKTRMIGVLIYSGNSYFSTIGEAIQEGLLANGFCPLSLTLNWLKRLEQIRFLIDRRVDGIIMVSPQIGLTPEEKAEVEQIRIPVVYVEPGLSEPLDWVDTDDAAGGKLMADYLYRMGHRVIGIYPCSEDIPLPLWERVSSFVEVAGKKGMECIRIDEKMLEKQLAEHEDMTAVYCTTDVTAVKLMKQLRALGYSVPEDISVAGYADLDYAEKVTPTLTTIHQDGALIGKRAAEIMINRLQNPDSAIIHELLPVRLIERESVISISRTSKPTKGKTKCSQKRV